MCELIIASPSLVTPDNPMMERQVLDDKSNRVNAMWQQLTTIVNSPNQTDFNPTNNFRQNEYVRDIDPSLVPSKEITVQKLKATVNNLRSGNNYSTRYGVCV